MKSFVRGASMAKRSITFTWPSSSFARIAASRAARRARFGMFQP